MYFIKVSIVTLSSLDDEENAYVMRMMFKIYADVICLVYKSSAINHIALDFFRGRKGW